MSIAKATRPRGRISKPSIPQPTRTLHRRPMLEFFHNVFASLETMLLVPSVFRTVSLARKNHIRDVVRPTIRPLEDLAQEVNQLFSSPLNLQKMLAMSELMRVQFREKLQTSPMCMLPSYNHTLPTGEERGTFLALDVGGSTFRVALVELSGEGPEEEKMRIQRMVSTQISDDIKRLPGTKFFDWMAEKIEEMLVDGETYAQGNTPLTAGLAWSFPIEQTSMGSGKVQSTGKGFVCFDTVQGEDLNGLIQEACKRRGLHISLQAIINDGTAALLSRAYTDPSTRFSLILGTGTNAAIHLPVSAIGASKFGTRPQSWHDRATHVLVNTELSMFGGAGVLPMTRWDDHLNQTHRMPDFQPLEYMITGRYVGEIVRLIIVEAVETAGLFTGELPISLREPYSFDTSIVAAIIADDNATLSNSSKLLETRHPSSVTPTVADLFFLRTICAAVSNRAAGYLATSIHALWQLKNGAEAACPDVDSLAEEVQMEACAPATTEETMPSPPPKITIACEGSVINKFPGFRDSCQRYISEIIAYECATLREELLDDDSELEDIVILAPAREGAIFGAAVAVACLEEDAPSD